LFHKERLMSGLSKSKEERRGEERGVLGEPTNNP
jgi:hypothetical protein